MRSFAAGARLGVPIGVAMLAAVPVIAIERRINDARDEAVRADLVALPALLDRVDQLLAAGVIGQRVPNAADYQIATSIRLLMCFEDLAGIVECRPCGAYALRLVPEFPGLVPSVIPSGWLSFS
jgi:glutathione S-transferase